MSAVGVDPRGSPPPSRAAAPMLAVRNLSITFAGLRALDDVSFDVAAGGVTAVIGPNGAGKTTLFNCISGIYRGEGEIELDGESLTGQSAHARAAKGIARTFQTPTLIDDDTVLANVMVGGFPNTRAGLIRNMFLTPGARTEERRLREQAADALELMGILRFAAALVADLPHGVRRRVELARAVVAEPRLLLLDEPAAGISHVEALEFADLLTRIAAESGATLLLVEHNVPLVMRVASKVVVLDFGRGIADGDAAAVRQDPQVMAAYLGTED